MSVLSDFMIAPTTAGQDILALGVDAVKKYKGFKSTSITDLEIEILYSLVLDVPWNAELIPTSSR